MVESRAARCKGHAATVSHLDWSTDSKVLMSNCNAYEMLYWEAASGRQVKANQRDQRWASHTCILGFPVMGIWPVRLHASLGPLCMQNIPREGSSH